MPPRPFSALPPLDFHHEASPKAISGRTSYLRVRLEFLRYPHLITTIFNWCVFGPPRDFTHASSWTWIGHPVSGLQPVTICPIKTRFPFGFMTLSFNLATDCNSPDRSTKSTLSSIRYKYRPLQLLVNIGFQVLFHSPPGVLFTFPSQYYALSVTKEYLGLRGGPRFFHQGFTCLDVLWIPPCQLSFRIRGFHPLWLAFPKPFY